MSEINSMGYLRIANEVDRATVATILFKNGYSVSLARQKKNGKTYEYFVKYQRNALDTPEQVIKDAD